MIYLGIFALCTICVLGGYLIGHRVGYQAGLEDANWRELEY